jgi:hypothetical protein
MEINKHSLGCIVHITERHPHGTVIEVDPAVISDLKWTSGELRHVYEILVGGMLGDPKELADGLISPQIERLERVIAGLEGSGPARPKPDDA